MLRLPGAGRYARGLGRAALALDFPAARTVLLEAIAALGIVATWDEVARPVLAAVARRWATTGAGVEIEHLLSQSVTAVFSAHVVAQAGEPDGRPVLLAGMPRRAAHAAAAGARGRARRPGRPRAADGHRPALRGRSSRPCAAPRPPRWCCGRSSRRRADVALLDALPETRPRSRTFVAGPGWRRSRGCPRGCSALTSLVEAVDALVTAAR